MLTTLQEPQTYEEAIVDPNWQNAMQKEFDALEANKIWELVTLPKGNKSISRKWVYKLKYKADGSIEKHKDRLIVKGLTQKNGVDYSKIFSPITKMTTVRSLIAMVIKRGWKLIGMQVYMPTA
ncbi:uncharacterized mitochondrial protein AtMg00820-like [Dioscorea cayenensis subsp. rotundata]|uniref:Uncharacterized mitochondrial protein AtMg00820-like n=1 Tax=Dioscorea cayennensis subsp. rotundata TaxID=55577 RepID=A0AB40BWS2_DIOCR|nr:uncharacterized mitochondrial protein AtMg00820-like [Dioscorea cayenensis subsp. rotundata]